MQEIIVFLSEIELLIYFVLGAITVLYIRRLFIDINTYRTAIFGLEKEIAQRKISKTVTILVLLLMLIILEFSIVTFIKPELPQVPSYAKLEDTETPTPSLTNTGPVPTDATKTPTPYPQAKVEGMTSACQEGILEFTYPIQGDSVQGIVELIGTVNIENFGSYKYEFSQVGPLSWITVAAGSEVKIEESLGFWYTANLTPGDYILRLVALDNQGVEQTPCMINVTVLPQD